LSSILFTQKQKGAAKTKRRQKIKGVNIMKKNYQHEGQKLQHIIDQYERGRGYNTIYDAYKNPSQAKINAYWSIWQDMKEKGGAGLLILSANTCTFTAVYKIGRFYVYKTAYNTYYIDGETGRASRSAGRLYVNKKKIEERKKVDRIDLQRISFISDIVDYIEELEGAEFFLQDKVERLRAYFRRWSRYYIIDKLKGVDGLEMFIDSLNNDIWRASINTITSSSSFFEEFWSAAIDDVLEDAVDAIGALSDEIGAAAYY
jgi:hypothetical protein